MLWHYYFILAMGCVVTIIHVFLLMFDNISNEVNMMNDLV